MIMQTPSYLATSRISFFVSIDIRGRIIQANDLLKRTVPAFSRSATGTKALEMVVPDDHPQFIKTFERCFLSSGSDPLNIQFRLYNQSYHAIKTNWEFTLIGGQGAGEPHIVGIGHALPSPSSN